MSMLCLVGQVTDYQLEKIKKDPKRIELLIDMEEDVEMPKRSFFQKLFSKKQPPVTSEEAKKAEHTCDLDKSWHALHYILNGDPWLGASPLKFLASGGEEIGEDVGYGPLRFLNALQTNQLKDELNKITVDDFDNRFNAAKLKSAEIYPTGDWTDAKPWLRENYISIKEFIEQTVADEKGIYIYIY